MCSSHPPPRAENSMNTIGLSNKWQHLDKGAHSQVVKKTGATTLALIFIAYQNFPELNDDY